MKGVPGSLRSSRPLMPSPSVPLISSHPYSGLEHVRVPPPHCAVPSRASFWPRLSFISPTSPAFVSTSTLGGDPKTTSTSATAEAVRSPLPVTMTWKRSSCPGASSPAAMTSTPAAAFSDSSESGWPAALTHSAPSDERERTRARLRERRVLCSLRRAASPSSIEHDHAYSSSEAEGSSGSCENASASRVNASSAP